VAEKVFEAMLVKEPKITVWKGWRLKLAEVSDNKLRGITMVNREKGDEKRLEAKIFIDATYEG